MFASANFLAYELGLRIVWFPDVNHVEANIDKGVFTASGVSQVSEKASFLARLPYGPARDAGHWHGQMKAAFRAFAAKLREGNPIVQEFFDIYLPRICSDLGLANPEQPHTIEAVCLGRQVCRDLVSVLSSCRNRVQKSLGRGACSKLCWVSGMVVDGRTKGRTGGCTHGRADERINERTDERTHGRTDERKHG